MAKKDVPQTMEEMVPGRFYAHYIVAKIMGLTSRELQRMGDKKMISYTPVGMTGARRYSRADVERVFSRSE